MTYYIINITREKFKIYFRQVKKYFLFCFLIFKIYACNVYT